MTLYLAPLFLLTTFLADSLQGWAFHDDSQIAEIHATRHEDKRCPRVELEISQL